MVERKRNRVWSGVAAVILMLSAAACGAGTPETSSSSSVASSAPQVEQEPPQDYAIDECLVGVWITVSQRQEASVNNEPVVMIDVERQLTFSSDGVEVVTYFDTPAAVLGPTGEQLGDVVHSGEVTYQVSTDEPGTISFEVTGGQLSATFDIRGQSSTLTSDGASGPVAYTCTAGELTQSATGYEAVFTRAV